jgi:Na+-transporting NADH:ubiquinone oxidoreductase subunit NqrC
MTPNAHHRPSRTLATLLSISLLCSVPLANVQAGMLDTAQLAQQQQSQQQRQDIQSLLAREDVAAYLSEQGVDAADLQGRINSLSDAEINRMHDQLNELPAGGSVLGAVLLIIVIFMLLDMGGVTDIFPRI